MSNFISALSIADYIALAIVLIAVAAALYYMKKSRKNGCCGGCTGCAYSESCNKKKETEEDGK